MISFIIIWWPLSSLTTGGVTTSGTIIFVEVNTNEVTCLLHGSCCLTANVTEMSQKCWNMLQWAFFFDHFCRKQIKVTRVMQHKTAHIHYRTATDTKIQQCQSTLTSAFGHEFSSTSHRPLLKYTWKIVLHSWMDPIFCRKVQTSSIHCVQEGHLIMWTVVINFFSSMTKRFPLWRWGMERKVEGKVILSWDGL